MPAPEPATLWHPSPNVCARSVRYQFAVFFHVIWLRCLRGAPLSWSLSEASARLAPTKLATNSKHDIFRRRILNAAKWRGLFIPVISAREHDYSSTVREMQVSGMDVGTKTSVRASVHA